MLSAWTGGSLVWAAFGVIAVVFGAYYATYLVAKRANNVQQGRAVRVLDRFAVGKDKMFVLLSMADVVYLVGMADGAITVVDRVTGERAEQIRESCENSFKSGIISRGAGLLGGMLSGARFNGELERARRSVENDDAGVDVEELALRFAREEDDIDTVQRKIDTRMKSRDDRDGTDGGERQ